MMKPSILIHKPKDILQINVEICWIVLLVIVLLLKLGRVCKKRGLSKFKLYLKQHLKRFLFQIITIVS